MRKRVINLGIAQAKKSDVRRGKIAALLMDGNRVVLTAYNKHVSIPGKYTLHAEEVLIAKAARLGIRCEGLDVLVIRWRKGDDSLAIAKPCAKCQSLLDKAGIARVFYSNYSGDIQCQS